MTNPKVLQERTQILVPPDSNVLRVDNQSRPNVYNSEVVIFYNTISTDVEYLLGGVNGQLLRILSLDADTVLKYDFGLGKGRIFPNTLADKTLDLYRIYTFTYWDGVWYENAN